MVGSRDEHCPACGAAVAGDTWCAACGLELGGAEAQQLTALAVQLAAAEAELQVIWTRRDELAKQLSARQWARGMNAAQPAAVMPQGSTAPGTASTLPTGPRRSGEWDGNQVRDLLLWAGAALLALSALAFTAVAWTHLGPTGRASLLVVVTIIAAAGATAARTRRPATSDALTGLAIALALIDWQVARRAGAAPGLSGAAWWAIGTGVVGLASLGLGRIAARCTAHRAVVLLVPTSAVLTVVAGAPGAWAASLGFSLLAAALVAVDLVTRDRVADPVVRMLLRIEARASWIVGAVVAIGAAFMANTFVQTLTPAGVVLTLAVAPALVLRLSATNTNDRIHMATLVLATCFGAALTMASTSMGVIGLLTFAVTLGSAAIVSAPRLAAIWKQAAQRVGWLSVAPGVTLAGSLALVAEFGPLAWLGHAWTGTTTVSALSVVSGPDTTPLHSMGWCVVGVLVSLAFATALAFRSGGETPVERSFPWPTVPWGLVLSAVAMAPLAAGSSVRVACAVMTTAMLVALIASALAVRDAEDRAAPYASLALLPAIPLAGWAATTPAASIAVLAVVVVAAAVAAVLARVPALRAAYAEFGAVATITLTAVIALAGGSSVEAAGFAGAVIAGVLLVVGSQARRDTFDGIALEVAGALGLVGGALLASQSPAWLAGTLTASVPLLLAASLRGHRSKYYGGVAALVALGATWAWLAAAGVTVAEAYTLPAAAVAVGLGSMARRDGPAHSWLSVGPAIVLALGPTLVLAIARSDDRRAIAVGLVALVVVLAGARQQLQAPIVLGAFTLLILAVDKLGPTAERLPRWLMLAFAGSVLLWVGTTFERRRDSALRAARRFEHLG
jgi:hypothetical protein